MLELALRADAQEARGGGVAGRVVGPRHVPLQDPEVRLGEHPHPEGGGDRQPLAVDGLDRASDGFGDALLVEQEPALRSAR